MALYWVGLITGKSFVSIFGGDSELGSKKKMSAFFTGIVLRFLKLIFLQFTHVCIAGLFSYLRTHCTFQECRLQKTSIAVGKKASLLR